MKDAIKNLREHLDVVFLFLIPAFVFLPYTIRLTYYLDDWYYIYSDIVAGPNIFHSMFIIDRPARGYFFDLYFSLFGAEPFPYHFGLFLWHIFAGFVAFWLLQLLWQDNRKFNLIIALLFVLYPGFSWWVSGVEYQPMVASLALQIVSMIFTLKNISVNSPLRWLYFIGAILTGWGYIVLVEYAIGMEGMRLLIIYLFIRKRQIDLSIFQKFFIWIGSLIIPIGFVFWRIFIFDNQRKTTDISLQLLSLREMPFETIKKWIDNFIYSLININASWITQFKYQFENSGIRLNEIVWGTTIVVFSLTLLFILQANQKRNSTAVYEESFKDGKEIAILGFICLGIGILPVIFTNRFVNLTIYSHYGLPVSLPAAMLLAGAIQCIFRSRSIQYILIYGIVTFSVLAHFLIAEKTIFLKEVLENFWWQAYWRIPGLYPDTTLITQYPDGRVADGKYGRPQAVNLIYFPEGQIELPIRYPVSTLMPFDENINSILMGYPRKKDGARAYEFVIDYQNILVLSQPNLQSCVHIVDGSMYVLSQYETEAIRSIADYSAIKNIRLEVVQKPPPSFAFGEEPIHDWCYFYQKAGLALQRGDLNEVSRLGNEAYEKGLYPSDMSEWMPFWVAYLKIKDDQALKRVFEYIKSDTETLKNFCNIIHDISYTIEIDKLTIELYCKTN